MASKISCISNPATAPGLLFPTLSGPKECLGDSDCVKQVAEMRPFFRLSMSPMVNSLPKDLIYLVYHVTLG
ncbi:hypothetical protein EA579_23335 [Salmonella enterica]|nr:hypothetical protein [Salmonella enterica subsp. enterica serovar Oranienburg]EAR0412090.1 hypothetical protein [Salmonella enterica subsp. enterica serovar Oranienburg]EAS6825464.1 hypothetical protein [Salmonella enterica subsp. enterica serovar Give]EBR2769013.1 hypothetical protein [Salmonella enterica]ECQ1397354.1 hypothetical protein [Salmonella enterica subsp. enterica serovar Cubana]